MYEAKDFSHLLGTAGMSETLLNNHFTLYQGYVKNTNTLLEKCKSAEIGTPEYAEFHRRLGWEWSGMRMHELYFEGLAKDATRLGEKTTVLLERDFGSLDAFKKKIAAIGTMRGIGWVVWVMDEIKGNTFLHWIGEHEMGQLPGVRVLLAMDVWEHAYITDYGIKRADYITAYLQAINWDVVEKRLL
jgi:Fe-Mn family superoxide dismutase